ncbi:MAG TPA: M48 family metallopeptidase [Pyrinomonadaceae bacterium]
MMTIGRNRSKGLSALLLAFAMFVMPLAALGQTRVEMPKNKYQVTEDVRAGQQAAQQVYQQMPILRDDAVRGYVNRVGQNLVSAIPSEFQQSAFRYTFDVVDARDINAFALPGGPMFVNRGMIEAARNEGEMAGVMAHEISHVALRHASAQQTKATSAKSTIIGLGAILGGAILGGQTGAGIGQIVAQGYFMKYSREYETQADILGSQIMARAGYDPRDLANMFRTIAQQSGGSGAPEWLSSHPNPGNREQRILQEAAMLRVEGGRGDTAEFRQIQSRLRGYPRARSMEEIARSGQRYPNQGGQQYPDQNYPEQGGVYARGERVAYPSTNYQTQRNNLFSVAIPSNWRQLGDQSSVSYAPEGAYGSQGITHGVMFSVAQSNYNDLQRASQEVVQGLAQGNNYLRQTGGFQRTTIDGRAALATTLVGRSPLTGRSERVTLVTTLLGNGQVFYMAAVSPQNEYATYQRAFNDIVRSLQLNGR